MQKGSALEVNSLTPIFSFYLWSIQGRKPAKDTMSALQGLLQTFTHVLLYLNCIQNAVTRRYTLFLFTHAEEEKAREGGQRREKRN